MLSKLIWVYGLYFKMKELIFDHEVVVEQTLSYLFAAKNILNSIPRSFDIVFLPRSHHLYTGVLQAASYWALQNKNKFILIFEWNNDDKILIYNKSIWPFLWKKRKFDKSLERLKNKFDFLEFCDFWKESIYSQLPYLRMFLDIKNLINIYIWSKVKKQDFINFILEFDIESDFNLAFISDINVENQNNELLLIKDKKNWLEKLNDSFFHKNIVLKMFCELIKFNSMNLKIFSQTDSVLMAWDRNKAIVYLSAGAK